MEPVQVGLLGCGTVGTGVARLIMHNRDVIRARAGVDIHLKYVADIDTASDRGLTFEKGVFIEDAATVVEDAGIDIVVEMIGGEKIAKDLILRAIDKGKHVVTANKALLASQGDMLLQAAIDKGVDLAFEASVGGCMPIIKTIRESLVGNHIREMTGILNGTCNFILSRIAGRGDTFADALAEAQAIGYAEADPTLDVEGFDTAHKLTILNALAYGMDLNLQDIYREGITRITPMDLDFAKKFGYTVKLLAISKKAADCIEARIHPTMIPCSDMLANVNGSLNAVTVNADAVDDILLYGHGAGMLPTASAVIGDVVDLARNLGHDAAGRVPPFSFQPDSRRTVPIMPITDLKTHYYFRFAAVDRPGVLSKIAGILGAHDISLKSVHQHGREENGGAVPIVMLTHLARESAVQRAFEAISQLDVVRDDPVLIRIEDTGAEHEGPGC